MACVHDLKLLQNCHVSIRVGPLSNRIRRYGLKKHIFYIIRMAGYMCFTYLGKKWHQDAVWDANKLVEKVCCSG